MTMKAPFWIGPFFILLLTTCQPKLDDSVLPGVTRIRLLATNNQKQLYLVEDTVNNRIILNVRYLDANNSVVTSTVEPQFLVNGKPFAGNTYRLEQPGQYTFTAQVGNKLAENQVGPLTVVRVADHVGTFAVKTAVSFVNADSVSRLPLVYQLTDKQGKSLNYLDYPLPTLIVNGVRHKADDGFMTPKAGPYALQAEFLGIQSNTLTVTARLPVNYPVVRLPVVIHVPKSMNATEINPARILAEVNRTFRKGLTSVDPNQADAYLEFFPAPTDPGNRPLAVAGLHRLNFDNPVSVIEAFRSVTEVLHEWCPQQYINVFVSVDWLRTYPPGYSFSYLPATAVNRANSTCEELKTVTWAAEQMPAIHINNQNAFSILAHELGHFFSLRHTFDRGCSATHQVSDTPVHQEAQPTDRIDAKYTCDQIPFRSNYVMDYWVPYNSFTHEQVGLIRTHLTNGAYIPTASVRNGGRRGSIKGAYLLETGRIVSCAPQP